MSTPSWLSDRDSDAPPADLHAAPEAHGWAQNNNSMGSGNNNSNGKSNSDTKGNSLVKSIFAFICTGICVFVSATGALAVQFSTSQGRVSALTPDGATLCSPTDATMCSTQAQDIANSFVGVYMVLFALILFVFECAQLCKISCLDHIWKVSITLYRSA